MTQTKRNEHFSFSRFTKVDWYAWAGAAEFESGGQPFVMECSAGLIIADAGSVSVYGMDSAGATEEAYRRDYVSKDAECEAEVVLTAIATHTLAPETLLAFGFKEVAK